MLNRSRRSLIRKPSSRRPASLPKGAASSSRRYFAVAGIGFSVAVFCFLGGSLPVASAADGADSAPAKPNILWITSEDNGPELGCYGDEYAVTPRLDAFAQRSLRYRTCWSNAPVCAPARTTLIAGMYATSLGGHHMRSAVKLPPEVKRYPEVLREAGYYCTNNHKTDYNFAAPDSEAGWNKIGTKAHWRDRPDKSTPFFAVFNFTISHESKIRNKPHTLVHDPAKAPLPAYHPDVPAVRRDWAQYYDRLTEMDAMVGKVLDELREDGLEDSTIVFYYGDHGSGMPRSKRWPFDSGLRVPLILHIPAKYAHLRPAGYQPGAMSDRLVSFVDLGPTAISLAGATPAETMQGVPFCGPAEGPSKEYLLGYRGRMDERVDMVRSITDGRFVYMRHFYPDRPYLKHVDYMFQTPTTRVWKEMYDAGELSPEQAKFWQTKPVEELFDLKSDPDEVHDVSYDPKYAADLKRMRSALKNWMVETRDLGVLPESLMHAMTDAADVSPWTLVRQDDFPMEKLVDVAWDVTENWAVANASTVDGLVQLAGSEQAAVRYWAARGLKLALDSHGTVLDQTTLVSARTTLQELLDDDSPTVRVAAANGLLVSNDDSARQDAMEELLQLADVRQQSHFVAAEALNIIDDRRELLDESLTTSLRSLPMRSDEPPRRASGYVERLLTYLDESL